MTSAAPQSSTAVAAPRPIAVDMDLTLLRTDTLVESVIVLLRRRPWCLLLLPVWLLRGKAHLKRRIAERVLPDVATLPVNEPLLAWLREQHAAGVPLHLVSAADAGIVRAVAARFGLFAGAQGSDGMVNLSGARKLAAIRAALGDQATYAGDSPQDLVIWRALGSAVLVGPAARLRARLPPEVTVVATFEAPRMGPRDWARALRLHQWAKNALVFVAALLGGRLLEEAPASAQAFLVFGLVASATYLVNDMLDLAHDRVHRSKRHRPLASGLLPLPWAMLAVLLLLAVAAGIMALLPAAFAWVVLLYVAITLAYSVRLKRMLMLDVVVLAGLFTIRIAAGIAALGHPAAPWLMAFSLLFFLSLACVKRHGECLVTGAAGLPGVPGRAYRPADAPWLMAMGAGSGFAALTTFFLFLVESGSPIAHYPEPRWMWLICVILGYWLCRTWALAARGEMHDDPVLFALRDRQSLALAGLSGLLVLLARS